MLPVTTNLQYANMVTRWPSKDLENKDSFHVATVQSIERHASAARGTSVRLHGLVRRPR